MLVTRVHVLRFYSLEKSMGWYSRVRAMFIIHGIRVGINELN